MAVWKNKGERRRLLSSPWSSHHGPDEKWGMERRKANRTERDFGGKAHLDERGGSRRNQSLLGFWLEQDGLRQRTVEDDQGCL